MPTAKISTGWESFSRNIILVLVFLLPFWLLPIEGFGLSLSKSLLVYGALLAATVFYLIHLLQQGEINYPRGLVFLSLVILSVVTLVSSLFSGVISVSLFGSMAEIDTFFFLFILVLGLFLVTQLFQSVKHALLFFFTLLFSSIVVFLLQFFHSVFGFSLGLIAKTDTFVGLWNELAIFFGLTALLSTVFLEFSSNKTSQLQLSHAWRTLLFVILGLSLLVMAVVNFTAIWFVFVALLVVFFVYLISSSVGGSRNLLRLSFFLILISVFFILAKPLLGDAVVSMGFNTIDVRPSWGATFSVVKNTLSDGVKNVFIGSGPNTFVYNWLKFKPIEINQTVFWASRFQGGIGTLPSFIAGVGILGFLAWLSFLLLIPFYGFGVISYSGEPAIKSLLFSSFLASVYLWIFSVIYISGVTLFALAFLATGLFFAVLVKSGRLEVKKRAFLNKSTFGFVSALIVILLLIGSIAAFYLIFQKYWAANLFNRGLIVLNREGDLDKAEGKIVKAARFNEQARYYRALSEVGLLRISSLVNQQDSFSQSELISQLQNLIAFSVQNAQAAIQINSLDSLNWMALGQVYERLVSLQIQGSKEAALDAYQNALKKGPSDPRPWFSSARVEAQVGNNEAARLALQSALSLKSNYTSALFLLAQISAQEGNIDEAIRQTEMARLTAPSDVGVLFQLGLLYYQKEDYRNASLALERAVELSSNYSNARYFLGLAYDMQEMKQKAIEQFSVLVELNPDNAEVKNILSNLRAGKRALTEISPPEPAPEEREELPIEEE